MLLFIITPEHESAKLLQCFNTSHVVIYLVHSIREIFCSVCFNTSHVVIYRAFEDFEEFGETGFNTSHVVIYRSKV